MCYFYKTFDKLFRNIIIWSFLCIKYGFEIGSHSIQSFEIDIKRTWFMFLVSLGIGFFWIWLTSVYGNSKTFKISIYYERKRKFFEVIFEFYNTVFGWHYYSRCFIITAIITYRAKLLNADWLRQRAFFLNFPSMEGKITRS